MNCFDCARDGSIAPAVAICHDCGGGVCLEHAVAAERRLVRTATINRIIAVQPAGRLIRCATCAAADRAAHDDVGLTRARGERHAVSGR